MAFGGDMANASATAADFWTLTQADIDAITAKGVPGVYTTGNHEYSPGKISTTTNNTTSQYKMNTKGDEGDYYVLYCLGSDSSDQSYSSSQISTLTAFLNSQNNDKPIFIITHFPLHYYSGRTTGNASSVIDALNTAVQNGTPNDTSDDRTIVFLWGHNHTMSDTYYDQQDDPVLLWRRWMHERQ